MNKPGHILMTKQVIPKELKHYRMFILAGAIMPDLLIHTYVIGHTWKSAHRRVLKRLERLKYWGNVNAVSFFWLGYLLHYIEDFFTFPHNDAYTGSLAEHVAYEAKMYESLSEYYQRESVNINDMSFFTSDTVINDLLALHKEYMVKESSIDNDRYYMELATTGVLTCMAEIFARNESIVEAAKMESFQALNQLNVPGCKEV